MLPLPEGYKGDLITVEGEQQKWQTATTFSKLFYWNHDLVPSHSDNPQRLLTWLTVAQQVHTE